MIPRADGFPKEVEFPYPKPETAKRTGLVCPLLVQRPAVEDCFCADHGPTPDVSYMRYLRAKDTRLYDQLQSMRSAMANRACEVLEHPCPNVDTKMNAFHFVDYAKRGQYPGYYLSLSPAKICQVGSPIEPLRVGLTRGHRDPELFPFIPRSRHAVNKASPLKTTQSKFKEK